MNIHLEGKVKKLQLKIIILLIKLVPHNLYQNTIHAKFKELQKKLWKDSILSTIILETPFKRNYKNSLKVAVFTTIIILMQARTANFLMLVVISVQVFHKVSRAEEAESNQLEIQVELEVEKAVKYLWSTKTRTRQVN